MPDYSAIIRTVTPQKFTEILAASSRQAREVYFHRHHIKAPSSGSHFAKPGAKNEIRMARLYDIIVTAGDEELSEEILRTWLLGKRPMLAAAMDHLKIPHTDGLTDSDDVSKIATLSGKALEELITALEAFAPRDEVIVYLKFMGAVIA